jgi:CRISPR/Cas system-associated endoribonuclease Cas2
MRGEKILKILEILEDMAVSTLDLLDMWLFEQPRGIYGLERARLRRAGQKKQLFFAELREYLEEREKLSKLIYKLKSEGFILEDKKNKKLILTKKGKLKLRFLKNKKSVEETKNNESNQKDKDVIVVIYDVPESEHKKRHQLRNLLVNAGFNFVQKSVWIKQGKITEDFINFLKDLEVLHYTQIFKITQKGTIENI